MLYRTRWPNIAALSIAVLLTVDIEPTALRWLLGFLALTMGINLITFPQTKRLEEPPRILGLVDILAPLPLAVFVPGLIFPALVMSIMTATFVRLQHGRNLTLVGIALTTLVAGAFVLIRDIPFGVVTVVVYAISAVRITAGLSLVMRDEIRVAELMRSLAATDPLTGLPNRISFTSAFRETLARARKMDGRLAVLTIDLNGFKEINDLFGHDAGDELLCEVAARLRTATDHHLVARQGGDEFSVLIADAGTTNPSSVAEHVHRALSSPFELDAAQVCCGASIGIAVFPDHGATTSELATRADQAMYSAKRAHRRTLTYSPEDGQAGNRSVRLVGDLGRALASGEIVVEYRPGQRLADRVEVGADAEIVWHHPADGPLAVRDLGGLLGLASFGGVLWRWGLDQACGEAAARNADGEAWTVGIRVLATSLESPRLVADVALALDHSGLPANRLCIHVPETLARARRCVDQPIPRGAPPARGEGRHRRFRQRPHLARRAQPHGRHLHPAGRLPGPYPDRSAMRAGRHLAHRPDHRPGTGSRCARSGLVVDGRTRPRGGHHLRRRRGDRPSDTRSGSGTGRCLTKRIRRGSGPGGIRDTGSVGRSERTGTGPGVARHVASGATVASMASIRSSAATASSSPRRPPLTKHSSRIVTDSSTNDRSRFFWPSGLIPPTT